LTKRALSIHPAAIEETGAAVEWYRVRSERAAEGFLMELDRLIARISQHPEQFPEFELGTHRGIFRRFPYFVVFRETPAAIEILAVMHGRRRPGYWRTRI